MSLFWNTVYNWVVVPVIYAGINMAWLANPKIRAAIKGRKGLLRKLEKEAESIKGGFPRIWIHCSSMGEFEQAKPVISALRTKYPEGKTLVTFFSPSALEHITEIQGADCFCYLPFDSRKNAKKFYRLLKPDAALVVRHDIWPNHLQEVKKRKAPVLLINCSARSHTFTRFPLVRNMNRYIYHLFDRVLAVSRETKMLLKKYGLYDGPIEVTGDTRYDQVIRRANQAGEVIAPLQKMQGKRKCFVAGSTWHSDEEVILEAWGRYRRDHSDNWMILVPHEPTDENVDRIEQQIHEMGLKSVRFSTMNKSTDGGDVLIVDRIGILASLYALGDLTYVGGSFGPGVHNVLEPAALGRIVLFGPKHTNSYEARQLKRRNIGYCVEDSEALLNRLNEFLDDSPERMQKEKAAAKLVEENRGATDRILKTLEEIVQHP